MLGRDEIAARMPHAGAMCLLDRVLAWDAHGIRCAATSHRDAGHPLRGPGGLPVWAGIEYAAQAAAVHGALRRKSATPRKAVLASLREARPACERLDDLAGELELEATLLHDDPAGAIYAFGVHGGGRALLTGRFTLMFAGDAA